MIIAFSLRFGNKNKQKTKQSPTTSNNKKHTWRSLCSHCVGARPPLRSHMQLVCHGQPALAIGRLPQGHPLNPQSINCPGPEIKWLFATETLVHLKCLFTLFSHYILTTVSLLPRSTSVSLQKRGLLGLSTKHGITVTIRLGTYPHIKTGQGNPAEDKGSPEQAKVRDSPCSYTTITYMQRV